MFIVQESLVEARTILENGEEFPLAITKATIPVPSSLLLLAAGILTLVVRREV